MRVSSGGLPTTTPRPQRVHTLGASFTAVAVVSTVAPLPAALGGGVGGRGKPEAPAGKGIPGIPPGGAAPPIMLFNICCIIACWMSCCFDFAPSSSLPPRPASATPRATHTHGGKPDPAAALGGGGGGG